MKVKHNFPEWLIQSLNQCHNLCYHWNNITAATLLPVFSQLFSSTTTAWVKLDLFLFLLFYYFFSVWSGICYSFICSEIQNFTILVILWLSNKSDFLTRMTGCLVFLLLQFWNYLFAFCVSPQNTDGWEGYIVLCCLM